MTVGAGVDFGLLQENLVAIVGMTIGLIAIKAGVLWILAIVFKIHGADRWLFALGLAQASEFGFVLLSFTVASNVIPGAIADQLLLIFALSMLLTPLLFTLYDRVIVPRFATLETRETDTIDEANNIIIAGHGRMGVVISRMLTGAGHSATVIDYSSKQIVSSLSSDSRRSTAMPRALTFCISQTLKTPRSSLLRLTRNNRQLRWSTMSIPPIPMSTSSRGP